ncbi:MAG: hypothetical protein H6624_15545 [Bdellovibrionaceae bacterium]|nr:hypothetical protein [Pseudobdellovibrionaceae bacterium]
MNADKVPYFEWCPRCQEGSFERLKTYGHCVNCLYVEDYELEAQKAQVTSIENVRKLSKREMPSKSGTGNVIKFPKGA